VLHNPPTPRAGADLGFEPSPRRLILFGEGHLRRVLEQSSLHCYVERNHQGVDNELIDGDELAADGEIECRDRLGGLLEYDYRAA